MIVRMRTMMRRKWYEEEGACVQHVLTYSRLHVALACVSQFERRGNARLCHPSSTG